MTRTILFGLLTFSLFDTTLIAAERAERERTFLRSLELFDSATTPDEYLESAKVLETLVADGFRCGAVYYNLGNSYYRAGKYGRAILNYRKAKLYRPRDSYLMANLEQALVAAPGRLPETQRPWWIHILFWNEWFSYPIKVQIVFIALSLAAISIGAAGLFHRPRVHILTACLMVISSAVAIDVAMSYREVENSRRAVITGETIARKGMGNSYEAAFDQSLRDGAEFQVIAETPDWTFGHFENIGDGWVRNEFVAR